MDEAKAFRESSSTHQPGAAATVPRKAACRNKMKFWLLSILRVSRDYLDGKAEADSNAESGGNHEIHMLWVSK